MSHATSVLYWVILYIVSTIQYIMVLKYLQIRNKACEGLWFSTSLPTNLFLWIYQSLSLPSLPWFINPGGISATRNMKSRLVIKLPTPYEWWSNALPLGGLISSNSLPPAKEKASNAQGMPGAGGNVEALIWLVDDLVWTFEVPDWYFTCAITHSFNSLWIGSQNLHKLHVFILLTHCG